VRLLRRFCVVVFAEILGQDFVDLNLNLFAVKFFLRFSLFFLFVVLVMCFDTPSMEVSVRMANTCIPTLFLL
jgi:hypothetical protein